MAITDPVVIDGVTLDKSWITPRETPRLHLLPAHEERTCIVIMRKRSKLFHVMRWDASCDRVDFGSWFFGKLFPMRCDVSWDGRFMVYLAMGADGNTWNGVCEPPWLKTIIDCENVGTWAGGGIFTERAVLEANTHWHATNSLAAAGRIPGLEIRHRNSGGEDEPVLHRRLERDGWQRRGPSFGTDRRITSPRYFVANLDDDGWEWKPTKKHPALRCFYRGYFERGRTFEFELDGSSLLDLKVEWATWDKAGDLLVARDGGLELYTISDLAKKTPSFRMDLSSLQPHPAGPKA